MVDIDMYLPRYIRTLLRERGVIQEMFELRVERLVWVAIHSCALVYRLRMVGCVLWMLGMRRLELQYLYVFERRLIHRAGNASCNLCHVWDGPSPLWKFREEAGKLVITINGSSSINRGYIIFALYVYYLAYNMLT